MELNSCFSSSIPVKDEFFIVFNFGKLTECESLRKKKQ